MMKNSIKISSLFIIIILIGVTTYKVKTIEKNVILTLANIEALARYELPEVTVTCGQYEGRCWRMVDRDPWTGRYNCERTDDPKNGCW